MTDKDIKKQYIKEFGYSSFNKYNNTDYSKWLECQLISALNEVIKLGLHSVSQRSELVCEHNYVYKILYDHTAADVCTKCGNIN